MRNDVRPSYFNGALYFSVGESAALCVGYSGGDGESSTPFSQPRTEAAAHFSP